MTPASKPILYTVGHSTHPIDEFVGLLLRNDINAIADVRSSPFSRFNPQFNREHLALSLKQHGMHYVFLGRELGARREEPECYVGNKVRYDLIERTSSFQSGLQRLLRGAAMMNVAIMCAEKDPITCHRTILVARSAKHLFSEIFHILEDGSIEGHHHAEMRLLQAYRVQQEDMFLPLNERLEKAYCLRADEIAFEDQTHKTAI
jgi:uncharacterized protein (DUF488 family)